MKPDSTSSVEPTVSVVMATISRPTLARSLNSLVGQQWIPGDEVLVVGDGKQPIAKELCAQFKRRLPLLYVENTGPTGLWGHLARNWVLDNSLCSGRYLMALDDDDIYLPDAIRSARSDLSRSPELRPHVFRMVGHPTVGTVWKDPVLRLGNVSTVCLAMPNDPRKLGRYGHTYGGDYDFCFRTCAFYPLGPVWCETEICQVRPVR